MNEHLDLPLENVQSLRLRMRYINNRIKTLQTINQTPRDSYSVKFIDNNNNNTEIKHLILERDKLLNNYPEYFI